MAEFIKEKKLVDAVVADTTGTGYPCNYLKRFSVQLQTTGTLNATVTVEVTCDPVASTDASSEWTTLHTYTSDAEVMTTEGRYTKVRGKVASWVSGTITLNLVGVYDV